MGAVGVDLTGEHVAGDDAARLTVLDDDVEHVGAVVERDFASFDLGRESLVGAEQQLLAGLAAGIEGAAYLGAAE